MHKNKIHKNIKALRENIIVSLQLAILKIILRTTLSENLFQAFWQHIILRMRTTGINICACPALHVICK